MFEEPRINYPTLTRTEYVRRLCKKTMNTNSIYKIPLGAKNMYKYIIKIFNY